MPKNFVLDTNILVHDPYSIFQFEDNRLIILNSVQNELDRLKKTKFSAREAITLIEKVIDSAFDLYDYDELSGAWLDGFIDIPLNNGGIICFEQSIELKEYADPDILTWVMEFNDSEKAEKLGPAIIVSKDKCVRNKGKLNGLKAEDFTTDRVSEVYNGFLELNVPSFLIDAIYYQPSTGVFLDKAYLGENPIYPNQIIQLNSYERTQTALSIYQNNRLYRLPNYPELKIKHQNREQHIALSLLFDPTISGVFILGEAGSGKTLLSILAGYEQVKRGQYQTLIIATGMQTLGKDPGALPGDLDHKTRPWLNPILDNFKLIFQKEDNEVLTNDEVLERLMQTIDVEIVPIAYIRGRTFNNAFIILDEAQNESPHEMKAVLTRNGKNSKMVVVGDPTDNQIDNVYLTSRSNGLVYAVDRMKHSEHSATIMLPKNERSPFSADATRYL